MQPKRYIAGRGCGCDRPYHARLRPAGKLGSLSGKQGLESSAFLHSFCLYPPFADGQGTRFLYDHRSLEDLCGIYSYRMRRNTYLHRDRALSGYVLFHNLDGTFSNGWEYKHGQVVDRIVSPRKAKRLGLTGPALVLYRCEASYEVSLKMDNQSRIQTRSTGESDFLDDGSYLLDEVIVVGHGGGGGVPFYPGSGGVSTGGSSGGGSSGGSSGHGGSGSKNPGGYEPDFPEDDNTPPTAKNFIEKVITEALKKNVRTILKIEPDDIRVIVTNIQSENPMALAAYKDGKIYIYNKMFKSNLTRTDMESCVFHEFVHATQPPLPTDEKGNVLTKEYDVQYTGIELQDAESDFIDIL